jgi:hypothetical protein
MRQLCGSEVTRIAGGYPITQRGMENVFGTLWASPASLAVRTNTGAATVIMVFQASYSLGTFINDNFGGSIANAIDWVMEKASEVFASDFGVSSGGGGGGLNWGDEYECPILQGVTMAEV